ncbi:hypothetical protein FLAG1_02140 [Fusarium langsethiae]|uniref:Uncharacterized protein n=1 Tax=Fusarium langsethiae TaxID=179993 RepID=A0A0N0V820_FUSLA|nr:hypothetical protein FLAG1_02140 [Fusarium langsethiae]GKT98967.1 unnamed protein product [Fusarium langsethiae]GKU15443.1 unnamed protein product [Fusarium langsethiae]
MENANLPADEISISMRDAIDATTIIVNRLPRQLIVNESQLTFEELYTCGGLADLERTLYHQQEVDQTMRDCAHMANRDIPMRPRTFPDTNVRVGVLDHDHPPTGKHAGTKQPPERQQGATVFLSVKIESLEETVSFLWKDSRGRPVSPTHVRLSLGSMGEAVALAVEQYDRSMTKAYDIHNSEYVINETRRRVRHFSQAGSVGGGHLPPSFREPELEQPELAFPQAWSLGLEWARAMHIMNLQERR